MVQALDGRRLNVGILLFDDVEVSDFVGPYEVLWRTRLKGGLTSQRTDATAPFRVFTIAAVQETIVATSGARYIEFRRQR
jgi:putative intracellular protease/amidase